jgi:SAM-dependent methyltransferase
VTDLALAPTSPTRTTKGVDALSGQEAARMMARLNADMEHAAIELLRPRNDERFLVIGPGPGVGVLALLDTIFPGGVVAIDPSRTMLHAAADRVRPHPYGDRVRLGALFALDIPPSAGPFDAAVAVNSQHLWQPHAESLKAIGQTMGAGGRLVTLTHLWAITRRGPLEEWQGLVAADLEHAGFEAPTWSTGRYRTGEGVALVARKAEAAGEEPGALTT